MANEFEAANKRAQRQATSGTSVRKARFDRSSRRIVLTLKSGIELIFSPRQVQGLEAASAADLGSIEISPSGNGIFFPKLDVDVYVPALLEGYFGSRRWMAAKLGAEGGRTTTVKKARAARANGKLGGRPKKAAG